MNRLVSNKVYKSLYNRWYYLENRDYLLEYGRIYYEINREECLDRARAYRLERILEDITGREDVSPVLAPVFRPSPP